MEKAIDTILAGESVAEQMQKARISFANRGTATMIGELRQGSANCLVLRRDGELVFVSIGGAITNALKSTAGQWLNDNGLECSNPLFEVLTASEIARMRTIDAAANYLIRRGYEVLDIDWSFNSSSIGVVAKDEDGEQVFIRVAEPRQAGLDADFEDKTLPSRSVLEMAAAMWLSEHSDTAEGRIRFDSISMLVVGKDRAMLKHHVNCMNSSDCPE